MWWTHWTGLNWSAVKVNKPSSRTEQDQKIKKRKPSFNELSKINDSPFASREKDEEGRSVETKSHIEHFSLNASLEYQFLVFVMKFS